MADRSMVLKVSAPKGWSSLWPQLSPMIQVRSVSSFKAAGLGSERGMPALLLEHLKQGGHEDLALVPSCLSLEPNGDPNRWGSQQAAQLSTALSLSCSSK